MKKVLRERKLCLICMEEHEVDTVQVIDTEIFKDQEVTFTATYEYCSNAEEFLETEAMIKANSLAMKDAYRSKAGLLTSGEIIAIRERFGVSQKDFSEILNWAVQRLPDMKVIRCKARCTTMCCARSMKILSGLWKC